MKSAPVFVVGTGRCGTTLLRLMIDSHSALCCGSEDHLAIETNRELRRIHASGRPLHARTVEPIDGANVARWRGTIAAADLRSFEAIAGALLGEYGYETLYEESLDVLERCRAIVDVARFSVRDLGLRLRWEIHVARRDVARVLRGERPDATAISDGAT